MFVLCLISGLMIPLPKLTVVQEAVKLAPSLTFIKPLEVLQVFNAGLKHCDDCLGLCIDIPEGAVPVGVVLHLEVGMSLYGPFEFQDETSLISPILMLYPQEDITLLKPIRVTLPHMIDQANERDVEALGIRVVKADHSLQCASSAKYVFTDVDANITFERKGQDENIKEFATFSLIHFCFISLRSKTNSEVATRKGYCICPFYPTRVSSATATPGHEFTYHLPITYYMDPWLEVIIKCLNKSYHSDIFFFSR